MSNYANTRIILTGLARRPWYRNVNWQLIGCVLFGAAVWAFIFWCASLAVKP